VVGIMRITTTHNKITIIIIITNIGINKKSPVKLDFFNIYYFLKNFQMPKEVVSLVKN
jgi:hypothetical protein